MTDGQQTSRDLGRTEIAAGQPTGSRKERKVNRNATKAHLHELGFIGVRLSMDARDYALIDIRNIPEERKKVAEAYFDSADGCHQHPDVDGYQWGVEI